MHEQFMGIHPRARKRLTQGAQISTIPGSSLRSGVANVEYTTSTYDTGCPHKNGDLLNLKELGGDFRWQFNYGGTDIVFGIAPGPEISDKRFKRLSVRRLLESALNGNGSKDLDNVMLLMVHPIGEVKGKDVLDGAISMDLIRRARWAVLNQDTRQITFRRGNAESRVA